MSTILQALQRSTALRVLKNSTALSLAILLERAIAFFLPWYVARVQGKEAWGKYSIAMAFVLITVNFAYWGLDQLLPREIARDRKRAGAFLANAGVISALASILIAAVAIGGVQTLNYEPYEQYLIYLSIACILLPRAEFTLCEALINGVERMEWVVVVRFPLTVLRIGASILLLSLGFGLEVLLVAWAAYYAAACAIYVLLFRRFVPDFHLQLDRSVMGTLAVQALPIVFTIFVGEGIRQADRLLLSQIWDTESVGVYSTGIMLVQLLYMLAPAMMNALYPVLSRAYLESQERFSVLVSQLFRLLAMGMFPVALTVVAFANLMILLAFGEEYAPSIAVLQVYALGIVPSFVARLLYRTLLAGNRERLTPLIVFVNSATVLVLDVLLIPQYGVLGAAAAVACYELVGLAQNLFWVSLKVTRFDLGRALLKPAGCVLVSALVYLGMAQLSLPVTRVASVDVEWRFPAAWLTALVVFAGALLVSRTVGRQDLALLSAVRKRGEGEE